MFDNLFTDKNNHSKDSNAVSLMDTENTTGRKRDQWGSYQEDN